VTVERDGEYTIHTLDKPDEPHGLIIPINDKEYYFIHARRPVGTRRITARTGRTHFQGKQIQRYGMLRGSLSWSSSTTHIQTHPLNARDLQETKIYGHYALSLTPPTTTGPGYRNMWLGRFTISLQNPELVTEEGYRISVMSFDQGSGVAKVRISLRGDSGGGGGDGGGVWRRRRWRDDDCNCNQNRYWNSY
jgi:hypothetical protein